MARAWFGTRPAAALFTTAITQAEILFGVALMPSGRRRAALASAVDHMFADDFAGRVLPFDTAAAHEFAAISAERRRQGRPIAQLDAQIAAIARSLGATLATRNTRDFEHCGIGVVDPWQS